MEGLFLVILWDVALDDFYFLVIFYAFFSSEDPNLYYLFVRFYTFSIKEIFLNLICNQRIYGDIWQCCLNNPSSFIWLRQKYRRRIHFLKNFAFRNEKLRWFCLDLFLGIIVTDVINVCDFSVSVCFLYSFLLNITLIFS